LIDSLHTLNRDCLLENYWKAWSKCNILSDLRDIIPVRHYIHSTTFKFLVMKRAHHYLFLVLVSVGRLLLLVLMSLVISIIVISVSSPTLPTAACAVIRGAGWTLVLGVNA